MSSTKEHHSQLLELFDELNRLHFEGMLTPIELRFSNRLKTTGGQYIKRPLRKINISTRYFEMDDAWKEIRDTLGHELIHYWLDLQGKPCGHTPEFRVKLKACGFQRYSRLKPHKQRLVYRCPSCLTMYYRRRRGVWSCGPCSGSRYNSKFRLELYVEKK